MRQPTSSSTPFSIIPMATRKPMIALSALSAAAVFAFATAFRAPSSEPAGSRPGPAQDEGDESAQRYQGKPRILGHDAPRLGQWIRDLPFSAADGRELRLSDVMGKKGLVVVMRDSECPLCKRYGPRLAELEADWSDQGLGLLYVNINGEDDARADAKRHSLSGPHAIDASGDLAAELAASTTTETFILDAARTLRYRGMVDDQYGLGLRQARADTRVPEGSRRRGDRRRRRTCSGNRGARVSVDQEGPTSRDRRDHLPHPHLAHRSRTL